MDSEGHRRRITGRPAVLALAGVALCGTLAWASHRFVDVPTSANFHAAVNWVADRGGTLGCATNLYCPDDVVTRAQMALFMQRLGVALTPTVLASSTSIITGFSSLPTEAVHCQTGSHTPDFTQRAIVHSAFNFYTPGGFSYEVEAVYSTDGGANWAFFGGQPGRGGKASEVQAHYTSATDVAHRALDPGVTYRFGTRVRIVQGSFVAGNGGCEVMATIVHANPTIVPADVDLQ
jgi:hypothetical protein